MYEKELVEEMNRDRDAHGKKPFDDDDVYDEKYDCYICPNNKTLRYSTTNREGYRSIKARLTIVRNIPI
ncbi:MAG: hypothetical protein LUG13_01755 [Oscillospiraceae bacterium]|nr:hypothetical protein [Oscillospiraceae bacterium]